MSRMSTGGDEAGDVGHVRHEVGVVVVGDSAHAWVVVVPRVCRRARHQQLGPVQLGVCLQHVIIDQAGRLVQAVREALHRPASAKC